MTHVIEGFDCVYRWQRITLSSFDDKSKPPGDADLATTLGGPFVFWKKKLKRLVASRFAPLSMEWGFTSKKTG